MSMLQSTVMAEQASILTENGDKRIERSGLVNEFRISKICVTDYCILYEGQAGNHFYNTCFFTNYTGK